MPRVRNRQRRKSPKDIPNAELPTLIEQMVARINGCSAILDRIAPSNVYMTTKYEKLRARFRDQLRILHDEKKRRYLEGV